MFLEGEKEKLETSSALLSFLDSTAVLNFQILNLLTLHPVCHRVMGYGSCGQFKIVLICCFLPPHGDLFLPYGRLGQDIEQLSLQAGVLGREF